MYKRPNDNVPTMGVRVTDDGKFEMVYNPAFVDGLTDAEATFCFYHEVLHLALLHCTKRRLGEKELANIAMDLAVNDLIPVVSGACEYPVDKNGKIWILLPDELRKEEMYSDILNKQTPEWYYDYLLKKRKEQKDKGGSGDKGEGDPLEGKGSFDDHEGWKEHEVANERAKAKIREVQNMDTWGDVSQTTRELIMAAQIRKINWRQLIRVWFGNYADKTRRFTRKKPNRRTGFIHPGSTRNFVDKFLVAVDTSGSVDPDLLSEFIGVLNQLIEYLPIDLMQFDCDKTQDPHPYEKRMNKIEFHGRGGTNFQPVIDIVNKRHYKGVLILTDGEASEPTRPTKAQVLWVLPVGHNPPCSWGTVVHMQRHV